VQFHSGMSVTFSITTDRHDCECQLDCEVCWPRVLDVHQGNAAELLAALQIGTEPWGSVRGADLAAACRRVLSNPSFDVEDRVPGLAEVHQSGGVRVISIPRPAGRLREHVQKLLHMAELAGEIGCIAWS
jgi:hypothetical protein